MFGLFIDSLKEIINEENRNILFIEPFFIVLLFITSTSE
jgi:hypothetical protein